MIDERFWLGTRRTIDGALNEEGVVRSKDKSNGGSGSVVLSWTFSRE